MPQMTLEYTANTPQPVAGPAVFRGIHAILVELGGVPQDHCKSRAVQLDNYLIGDGDPSKGFAHLTLTILEGRSKELKQRIGEACLNHLNEYFKKALDELQFQITVEVKDMERATYFKIPKGTLDYFKG